MRSAVRPSMGGIPYLMDFLELGNETHLRPLAEKLIMKRLCDFNLHCTEYVSSLAEFMLCLPAPSF